jgi:hypothetical protein
VLPRKNVRVLYLVCSSSEIADMRDLISHYFATMARFRFECNCEIISGDTPFTERHRLL